MTKYIPSELDIIITLKMAWERYIANTVEYMGKSNKRVADFDLEYEAYKAEFSSEDITFWADQWDIIWSEKKIKYQQDAESITSFVELLNETAEIFLPLIEGESLIEIGKLLIPEHITQIEIGARLLQTDFRKRNDSSKNKVNFEEEGLIEKIFEQYNTLGLYEYEYKQLIIWLNIIAVIKWTEQVLAEKDPQRIYRSAITQPSFNEARDNLFIKCSESIKSIFNHPEKTFPRAKPDRIELFNKNKSRLIENGIRNLTYRFYNTSSDAHDQEEYDINKAKECIEDLIDSFPVILRITVMQFQQEKKIEYLIDYAAEKSPQAAVQAGTHMLKIFKRQDLRNEHIGLGDMGKAFRTYLIALIEEEIRYYENKITTSTHPTLDIKANAKQSTPKGTYCANADVTAAITRNHGTFRNWSTLARTEVEKIQSPGKNGPKYSRAEAQKIFYETYEEAFSACNRTIKQVLVGLENLANK